MQCWCNCVVAFVPFVMSCGCRLTSSVVFTRSPLSFGSCSFVFSVFSVFVFVSFFFSSDPSVLFVLVLFFSLLRFLPLCFPFRCQGRFTGHYLYCRSLLNWMVSRLDGSLPIGWLMLVGGAGWLSALPGLAGLAVLTTPNQPTLIKEI